MSFIVEESDGKPHSADIRRVLLVGNFGEYKKLRITYFDDNMNKHHNCYICGTRFKENSTIYMGLLKEKKKIYICSECASPYIV